MRWNAEAEAVSRSADRFFRWQADGNIAVPCFGIFSTVKRKFRGLRIFFPRPCDFRGAAVRFPFPAAALVFLPAFPRARRAMQEKIRGNPLHPRKSAFHPRLMA
jgi:hypothetical protein